jgi:hypothetical protein
MAAAAAPSWNRRSTVEQCDPNRGGEMAQAYEATSLSVSKSWSTPKGPRLRRFHGRAISRG